jgi:hypothetical protein
VFHCVLMKPLPPYTRYVNFVAVVATGCYVKNFVVFFYGTEESEIILLYKHLLWQRNGIKELIESYCELQNVSAFLCEAWHISYRARIKCSRLLCRD